MRAFRGTFRVVTLVALGLVLNLSPSRALQDKPQATPSGQTGAPSTAAAPAATSALLPSALQAPPVAPPPPGPQTSLNVVVIDPAHGGTDLGARGTEGIHESDVVLLFAAQLKQALEAQGFQVIMTREGNENPSFEDRSARANAQRGAVFITLHIASTGLAGTVHTYVMPEFPPFLDATGLILWDRAQAPFVGLSRKLGDLVQAELAKRFKGSPSTAETAPVRQLRTTAAPAIAVEVSSVVVQSRADLDRMIPGVADAIAHGVAEFRPSYVLPTLPGNALGAQP